MAADDRLEDDELARRLREAHRRVRLLPTAHRERFARRYLAICDLAKRDPERAATRLATFLAELNSESDTPGAQKNASGD
ncbi:MULTISPECIES: SCO5555 family protein [unclassified Nonomuraea]|uniref:hypothetical protein n=1 Tax=Nonomuraea sp. NPDC003804 TaxID=3154547 RepID=UPI0033A202A7